MDKEIIINEKLSIKIPSLDDAQDIYNAVDNDREHLRKYLKWVDDTVSINDTNENIKKRIEDFENGTAALYIIFYENKPIGSVGFISFNTKNMQGEIGYWLNSSFEGKGIMTNCVKAIIKQSIEKLKIHKIIIRCDFENIKSTGVPKRLGFTHEGTLRDDILHNNKYHNTYIFGLLSSEFTPPQP